MQQPRHLTMGLLLCLISCVEAPESAGRIGGAEVRGGSSDGQLIGGRARGGTNHRSMAASAGNPGQQTVSGGTTTAGTSVEPDGRIAEREATIGGGGDKTGGHAASSGQSAPDDNPLTAGGSGRVVQAAGRAAEQLVGGAAVLGGQAGQGGAVFSPMTDSNRATGNSGGATGGTTGDETANVGGRILVAGSPVDTSGQLAGQIVGGGGEGGGVETAGEPHIGVLGGTWAGQAASSERTAGASEDGPVGGDADIGGALMAGEHGSAGHLSAGEGATGGMPSTAGVNESEPPLGGSELAELACPDGRPALNIELTQDTVNLDGQTVEDMGRTAGSCGGGSGQDVYRLMTKRPGRYLVRLEAAGRDPLNFMTVYARQNCTDPMTEIACVDRRDGQVQLALQLSAGRPVYLFVDGAVSGRFASTGAYRLSISPVAPPVVNRVAAIYHAETGAFAVNINASAGSASLRGARIEAVDHQGLILNADAMIERLVAFEPDDGGSETGEVVFVSEIAAQSRAQVERVRVVVIDATDVRSAPREAPVSPPRMLLAGQACDVDNVRSICPSGTECFVGDPLVDPTPRCRLVGNQCPDAWTVDVLSEIVMNQRWQFRGNLARDNPPLEAHGLGTCAFAATGENDLIAFTAPEAGRYRFETSGTRGDTIIWVRAQCGIESGGAELGCDDDGGQGLFSRVEFELAQGQTVYVFVDAPGIQERGPYELTVSRR
ncbi:MAG: hypothetical protein VX589_13920 [Myxococcota bacterium]|nr:hypothetical protein [Myxococcota bacterium]